MSRRLRLHVPGGTYYVVQTGAGGNPIFDRAEDYRLFEQLLAATLRCTRSTLHAYCWLPDSIHCAITIDTTPVGRLMQAATGHYARSIQRRRGEQGHFFRHRYRATLIDPDEYLLPLVRYIHYLPVLRSHAKSPSEHTKSSDAAYRGARSSSWLTMRLVHRLLEVDQASGYAGFIALRPSPVDAQLFEHGCKDDSRVIGARAFTSSLPRQARTYRTSTTLDQLIDSVACRLGVDRDRVLSGSRERELALARAVIAWLATERRVAPLAEVARRMRRDPSTLSVGITRHRRRQPHLFDMETLCDLTPIGSLPAQREDEHLRTATMTTFASASV
jgi:putative transposase